MTFAQSALSDKNSLVRHYNLTSEESSLLFEYRQLADGSDSALSIIHWGPKIDISTLASNEISTSLIGSVPNCYFDKPITPGVMREQSRGWMGHPTMEGHRNGEMWSTRFSIKEINHDEKNQQLSVVLVDSQAELQLTYNFALSFSGVLRSWATLTNTGSTSYQLDQFTYWLPLPGHINEVLDFTGRWSHERAPQRRAIKYGLTTREMREGRSGHDYTITQLALTSQTNFSSGEVYAFSVGFSGNSVNHVEREPNGNISLGGGELLLPGEITVAPGASFDISQIYATYSNHGIDGVSDNFYRTIRKRPHHPTNIRPRPLTLNMWEAVYFNHDENKIKALVDRAHAIGVERVVLDDGWFHLRRNDFAGLGDWVIDESVWPQGLTSIIEYVNSKGMEFGLWFEGEMVNPNSDLYRAHPEWILHSADRVPPTARNQLVLDLTHEGAFNHVLEQVSYVLGNNNISYIKWDHNRMLIEASHFGKAAVHNQTLALYRLFDELKRRHPGLEIESCASGGGRIDLGMIDHADRFWTSDNNDALERQQIQRWTSVVIPPELLGSHVGPSHGHQTGRTHEISFRIANALFGHAGIEWDVTEANDEEFAALKAYATFYKKYRNIFHGGKIVRGDHPDPTVYVWGSVATDKSVGVFTYSQQQMLESVFPQKMRLPGLQKDAMYRVEIEKSWGLPRFLHTYINPWFETGLTLSGEMLSTIGVAIPNLAPENALVLVATKI